MDSNDRYLTKLDRLIPPFVAIVILTTVGLIAFRWLFAIQFHFVNIPEEYWEFWIPFALPWIPVLIWFRPRMGILLFDSKGRDPKTFYYMVAGFTTAAVMFFSQSYLSKATGKLEALSSISEINKKEKVRYYKLSDFELDFGHTGRFTVYGNSGGKSSHFDMDQYVAIPILSNSGEIIDSGNKCWYGIKFSKHLDHRVNDDDMNGYLDDFMQECTDQLGRYHFRDFDYFEHIPLSKDSKYFDKAINTVVKSRIDDSYIVLTPQKGEFEKRTGNKFVWIFGSFGIGLFLMLFALIFGDIDMAELKRQRSGIKPEKDTLIEMLKYLIPRDKHFATSVILDINIIVFVLMVLSGIDAISPGGDDMLLWGGNRRYEVLNGEWWRLFTSMFVHSGVMHLVLNAYGLIIASIFVEPLLGRRNYFILYLLSGFVGSVASIYWHVNTVSVGASGAIFGLFGANIGLALVQAFPKKSNWGILGMIGVYVIINLLWGMTGGIDNAAHIGGLVSGTVLGIALYKIDHLGEIQPAESSDDTETGQEE